MKAFDLDRVTHAPPPPPKACIACKSFQAECLVPVGEDAFPMCWICAHHVIEHDCPAHATVEARCECSPTEIYPNRVIETARDAGGTEVDYVRSGNVVTIVAERVVYDRPERRKRPRKVECTTCGAKGEAPCDDAIHEVIRATSGKR